MATYSVRVIQVFKVTRWINVDVEARSLKAAMELQAESDAPSDAAGWDSKWELENEEIEPSES